MVMPSFVVWSIFLFFTEFLAPYVDILMEKKLHFNITGFRMKWLLGAVCLLAILHFDLFVRGLTVGYIRDFLFQDDSLKKFTDRARYTRQTPENLLASVFIVVSTVLIKITTVTNGLRRLISTWPIIFYALNSLNCAGLFFTNFEGWLFCLCIIALFYSVPVSMGMEYSGMDVSMPEYEKHKDHYLIDDDTLGFGRLVVHVSKRKSVSYHPIESRCWTCKVKRRKLDQLPDWLLEKLEEKLKEDMAKGKFDREIYCKHFGRDD